MSRISAALLAMVCLVAGHALGGTRVNAVEDASQGRRFPGGMGAGTRVTLFFSGNPKIEVIDCTVARVDAGWVRCAQAEDPFKARPQEEVWYDLAHVVMVKKLDGQQ